MFANDRDLLSLEPTIFRDVSWLGQRLVRGVGSVSGTTLAMSSQDQGFDDAGVDTGHVVVIDAVAFEVIARTSASELEISRMRPSVTAPPIGAGAISDRPVEVPTFAPQLAIVHAQILRMLGLRAAGQPGDGPDESSVLNPAQLALPEALGAVHLVYAAAAATGGTAADLGARAALYRARFASERQLAAAQIDLDDDGHPDATRRMNVIQFARA